MSSPAPIDLNLAAPAGQVDSSAPHALAAAIARRRGMFAKPQRKIAAALVASLVLHLVFGSFAAFEPPEETIRPLTASFSTLPPPPVAVAAAQPPKPKPKPKAKPVVAANTAVAALPAVEPIVEAAKPEPEPVVAPPVAAPVETPVAAAAPELPVPRDEPPKRDEPPARLPPKKIELAYTAFLGESKFEVGPVNLQFTHDNGRYKLRVTGRGRGLAALLYPGSFTGESEGTITSEGLRPDKFYEERGNPDKRREISFDHVAKTVKLPEKEPLPYEGAPHDPLTWIVQFYFAAPKGNVGNANSTTDKSEKIAFTVASSRRLDTYSLQRVADETITVAMGPLDAFTGLREGKPVATQVWSGARKPDAEGKGGGSAQFWLSPEWHYVPFRLKVVNAQGRSASFELTGVKAE